MQKLLFIPVLILTGILLVGAGRAEQTTGNTASGVFAVH